MSVANDSASNQVGCVGSQSKNEKKKKIRNGTLAC